MKLRNTLAATLTLAFAATSLVALPGCAVTRDQQTVGAYVDDASITSAVKTKFLENSAVDTLSISVETLNGTVMLSGFAKNEGERSTAEALTRQVPGVKSVKNVISVRS